jgi:hypothetical protein
MWAATLRDRSRHGLLHEPIYDHAATRLPISLGERSARRLPSALVVVIFASGPEDAHIAEQKRIITVVGSGAEERDLAVVEFLGAKPLAQAMRA